MVRILWSGSRTRIRIRYHWDDERKWCEKDGDDDDAKDFDDDNDNVITARKMMMMITMMMISLTKIIAIMLSGLAPVG